jgi:nucleoside-diphosphate-sugar epimerase
VSPTAVVLGCGYVGLRLIRSLADSGVKVSAGTSRSERFAAVRKAGGSPFRADALEPSSLRALAELKPDAVFDLMRPQRLGPDRYTTWGTRNIAQAFADSPPGALVYLSSTSVYDTRINGWIDETSDVHPGSAFGDARLEAEQIYLEMLRSRGLPVRICRAPTIYGPFRTLRDRLESGAYSRVDDEEQWVSRIHVDDLATGLIAAWRKGRSGEVYLLCDDEPVTGRRYAELTADLLALPLPPPLPREDIRHELGSSSFERRAALGRCCNRRMREELEVQPTYPSVVEGIPASLREEGVI